MSLNIKRIKIFYYISLFGTLLIIVGVIIALLKQAKGGLLFFGGGGIFMINYLLNTFSILKSNDFQPKPNEQRYTRGLKFCRGICVLNASVFIIAGIVAFIFGIINIKLMAQELGMMFMPLYGFFLILLGFSIFYYVVKVHKMFV